MSFVQHPATMILFFMVLALTQTKVLARSLAALVFCGGNKEAAKALLFVRALFLARLPRTPTRLARARLVLHVIYIDRSSASLHVSRNTNTRARTLAAP